MLREFTNARFAAQPVVFFLVLLMMMLDALFTCSTWIFHLFGIFAAHIHDEYCYYSAFRDMQLRDDFTFSPFSIGTRPHHGATHVIDADDRPAHDGE